jgi:hypothetical protein
MIKIDTLLLIDLFNADSLDKEKFNQEQHKLEYTKMVSYLEGLCIETGITDVVYCAYGSEHELFSNGTDLVFKDHAKFPRERYSRHSCYDIQDKVDLFRNKSILVAGTSFYTCVRSRPLGIKFLKDSNIVKSIWSSPEIVGFYGEPNESTDQAFDRLDKPLELITAKEEHFRQDVNYPWRKVELTDNHSVYKCDIINSRNIINTQET